MAIRPYYVYEQKNLTYVPLTVGSDTSKWIFQKVTKHIPLVTYKISFIAGSSYSLNTTEQYKRESIGLYLVGQHDVGIIFHTTSFSKVYM